MGMFDDVNCEHWLPDNPGVPTNTLQTKDYECQLHRLRIDRLGRLFVSRFTFNASEDDCAHEPEEPDEEFTGTLEFYGSPGDKPGNGLVYWAGFFVRGHMVQVVKR